MGCKRCALLFGLLICAKTGANFKTGCDSSLLQVADTTFTLSNEKVDANTAESKCDTIGGKLAVLKNQIHREKLYEKYLSKYKDSDLKRVYIYFEPGFDKVYRYSYSTSATGSSYKSAKELGHLWYIDFFKTNASDRTAVYFCAPHNDKRWLVVYQPCPGGGWEFRFKYYAKSSPARGLKAVYNYLSLGNNALGNRLSAIDAPYFDFIHRKETFYVPDRSLYVGVRYNTTTNEWYWKDGTKANFTTNQSTCKQKAFQYEITDFENRHCTGQPAYFSCQLKFSTTIKTEKCNSTGVSVAIGKEVEKLGNWMGLVPNITINLKGEDGLNRSTTNGSNLHKTISGLRKRTKYTIQVKVSYVGCTSFVAISSHNFTTGYGVPDAIYGAYVKTSLPCVVSLGNNSLNANITSIKVSTRSGAGLTNVVQYNNLSVNQFAIDTKLHGKETRIDLTTQGVSCEGGGIVSEVKGYCYSPKAKPGQLTNLALIGGAVGIVVALVIALAIGIFCYKRKQNGSFKTSNAKIDFKTSQATATIKRENKQCIYENPAMAIETYRDELEEKRFGLRKLFLEKEANDKFHLEFKELVQIDKEKSKYSEHAMKQENAWKNRYKNIVTYDVARVTLAEQENDYINASYVPGYKNKTKFIATQGPKHDTLGDFWLMIWEQEAKIIVMLTGLTENGKRKCDKYWPDAGAKNTYGLVTVTLYEETVLGGLIRRKFYLTKNQREQQIVHYQYITWPDHGVPNTTSNMIYLRKMVVKESNNCTKPIVVHCSAGVGRTGTYITMDTLFDQMDAGEPVEVSSVVLRMRECRTDMVQTVAQYKFIHKLIAEHEMFPDTDRTSSDIQSMAESEMHVVSTEEFYLLSWTLPNAETTGDKLNLGIWVEEKQAVIKLDASTVQNFGCTVDFIASQHPTRVTEELFWELAVQQHVNVVVCLEDNSDDTVAALPNNRSAQFGKIVVTVLQSNEERGVTQKRLEIVLSSSTQRTERNIHYFLVNTNDKWGKGSMSKTLLETVQKVEQQEKGDNEGKVLVCCRNGRSKTGTFIALANILERLKVQDKVDVFRTVKDLRDVRLNMVDKVDHYTAIYTSVLDYLESFNTYSNYR